MRVGLMRLSTSRRQPNLQHGSNHDAQTVPTLDARTLPARRGHVALSRVRRRIPRARLDAVRVATARYKDVNVALNGTSVTLLPSAMPQR